MHFKEWVKNFYLTDTELVTSKRYLKWKMVALTGLALLLSSMIAVAVFGKSEAQPDYQNYQSLSADEVGKHGVMILAKDDGQVKSRTTTSNTYSSAHDQGQVITRKDRARGEYVIPAGSRISVVLDGEINSELAQSPVIATLPSGFTFQGRTLIPAGSRALGRVSQSQDSDRIAVVFDQIVFPNGHQVSSNAIAVMTDGSPGVVGDYHSSRGWKVAGALGSSFLSGAASAFQSTQANMFGIQQPEGSTRNAILNGVAQTTLDQAKRFSDEAQDTVGFVTIPSGTSFQIYLERETDLSGVMQ